MILVEWIDLEARSAGFEISGESGRELETRLTELDAAARALGIHAVELRVAGQPAAMQLRPLVLERARAEAAGVGTEAPPAVGLQHRTSRTGSLVRYELRLPHRVSSCSAIAAWTNLVLRAARTPIAELELVRLATYELGANAIQHGVPLAADATVEIGFELEAGRLRGWVRDRCAPFDPLQLAPNEVANLIRERRRRGWGLRIVLGAVESLQHTHDGNGNLLSFTKELTDVSSE